MSITILDGGMSRELQRLEAPFRQPEWSALSLFEAPDTVRQAHANFAAAGAAVITTNTYAVVPFHIGAERFATDGARLAGLAGRLAREAAEGTGARVAGSLPPICGSYRPDLFDEAIARPVLETLVAALAPHVDLWLAETLSATFEAALVRQVLGDDARPLWLSFTLDDTDMERVAAGAVPVTLRSGEPVRAAADTALTLGAAALSFNCSQPEVMEAAIVAARAVIGEAIPLGVYANALPPQRKEGSANDELDPVRRDLTPARYLDFARRWQAAGATMIGGCCGIGPDHIHALAEGFKAQ